MASMTMFLFRSPMLYDFSSSIGENVMKTLVSILAVALARAFTGPAFAGDLTTAKTAADCAKAGGIWNAATNACSAKKT
jgi:hypothetical protein